MYSLSIEALLRQTDVVPSIPHQIHRLTLKSVIISTELEESVQWKTTGTGE
jgi:hypothetical protein